MTVFEELDSLKKGCQIISYHAGQFIEAVDEFSAEDLLLEGEK
ncbi:hypothetical protein [Desulfosediminicola flagellatus]|nr:hypothetical protein [Desulfosediminicola flagellatus]